MDKKTSIKNLLISFVIVILFVAIIVIAFRLIINVIVVAVEKISMATSNLDAVIVVAFITGAVSILGVVLSSIVARIIEYRQTTKRYLYEKREEPYSEFIEMVYKLQENTNEPKTYSEEEMMSDIRHFSKKLTLWGSSHVIKEWLEFRKLSQSRNGTPEQNLFVLEKIIFEIRKDMGQKKRGLKQGDLLAFFINDIYDYLPNKAEK